MARPEFGTKCTCASCAERFYDLNRLPAVCPKCGAAQPPVVARAARPARMNFASARMGRRPVPVGVEEEAETLADVADEAADDEDEDEDIDDTAGVSEIKADRDVDPVVARD